MDSQVLLEITRGPIVDVRFRGDIAVVMSDGTLTNFIGDPHRPVYQRSSTKPFQALNFITSGAMEKYGISNEELALVCSSHYAEPVHLRVVSNILEKCGLNENHLKCGADYSFRQEVKEQQIWQNLQKRALFNDCSAKHASILATCQLRGYSLEDYNLITNPVQQDIKSIVEQMFGCIVDWGIDGCTLPAFITPLYNFALGYSRLADSDSVKDDKLSDACELVFQSMRRYPFMVAGTDGFCTELMTRCTGVVGKLGAEAVYGVGYQNLGMAVKIESGDYQRGLYPVVVEALEQLNIIEVGQMDQFKLVSNFNKVGDRVGSCRSTFQLQRQQCQLYKQ